MKNTLDAIRKASSGEDAKDTFNEVVAAFISFGVIGVAIAIMMSESFGQVVLFGLAGGGGAAALVFITEFPGRVLKHRRMIVQIYASKHRNPDQGITTWLPPVNPGWFRVGLVISVFWILLVATVAIVKIIAGIYISLEETALVLLVPPIALWALSFLAVIAWYWIRAGFTAGNAKNPPGK